MARILIVEDHADTAQILERLFGLEGHFTQVTDDPLEAIRLVRECCPDVVITDASMPNMDGYELARAIKQDCGAATRIIAFSGYPPSADAEKMRHLDGYLHKPVSLKQILKAAFDL